MNQQPYIAIIDIISKFSYKIAEELEKLGAKTDVLHYYNLFPLSTDFKPPDWNLIYLRTGGSIRVTFMLTMYLAYKNCKIINKPWSIFRTNNKFLGVATASKIMKTPKTYLIGKQIKHLQKIPEKLNFPFVIKPLLSAQGKGVELIKNKNDLNQYIGRLTKERLISHPVYVQEFIPYNKLIRLVIVGDKIIDAAYDTPKKNNWKTTVCLNPNVKPFRVNENLKKLSLSLKKATGQEICMLDIFECNDEYIFNEINNACDLRAMQQVTGINHAKEIAYYLIAQIKD